MNQIISQFQLFFAQQVNQLIYTIINFKPVKGLISEEWYARSDIKKTLGILCLIWNGLKDILWKSLYFLLADLTIEYRLERSYDGIDDGMDIFDPELFYGLLYQQPYYHQW